MPSKRFANLPEEKRRRIAEAAIAEYVQNGIDAAEVAGIVRRAGIPRGSFYQYFEDMNDLFGYVLSHLVTIKLVYLADVVAQAGKLPFVDYVETTFRAGLQFARTYPQGIAFARRVYSSADPVVAAHVKSAMQKGVEHYLPLIDQDKARGLIRQSVDSRVLARFVMAVFSDVVASAMLHEPGDDQEGMALADTLFDILRHGIQAHEGAD
jgi:AcrR family transcriptional regulator